METVTKVEELANVSHSHIDHRQHRETVPVDDAVSEILFYCTLHWEGAAEKAEFEAGLHEVVSNAVYDTENVTLTLTLIAVFARTREQAVDCVNVAAAVLADAYHVVLGSPNAIENPVLSESMTGIWNGNNA